MVCQLNWCPFPFPICLSWYDFFCTFLVYFSWHNIEQCGILFVISIKLKDNERELSQQISSCVLWGHSTFLSTTIYSPCVWHRMNGTDIHLKLVNSGLSCCTAVEKMGGWSTPQTFLAPLSLYSPSLPPSSSTLFRKAGEVSAGRALSLSLCSVVESVVLLRGRLVWTFKIRICNDTEQSREDAVITEQRTSDQGEEGPDQTHPLGSKDEPQTETSKLIHKAWLRVRRLLSHTLSKFVTSVYHLHPSSVNKHVICAAFPGPPTHPFHWQYREKN